MYTSENKSNIYIYRLPIAAIENTATTDEHVVDDDVLPSWKECGVQYENRILGGELLELDEFPWMALLIYNKDPR